MVKRFKALALCIVLIAPSSPLIPVAQAATYTFSCSPDPTPGSDDRATETLNITSTITIQVNNCNFAYTSGSVSPSANGTYIASGQLYTISGSGSLNVYVAGSYGKVWTFTSSVVSAPVNSVAPTISGTATFNSVLTANNGTWSGSPTYAHQWQRAATSGGSYSNISGATSSTYTLVSADVGQYLKVNVTATNAGGSVSALSAASSQIGKATQSSLSLSLSTSSKNYPYTQLLTFTPSGGSGTGTTSYSIFSGGTATGCVLSSDTATVTLTASSIGTCLIQASKAADSNYNAISSTTQTFTFGKATGSLSFSTTSYSKMYGETFTVLASGSGSGAVTYSKGVSTACDVNASTGVVTITSASGSCTISASIAADSNYLTANSSNSVTVTVSRATTSASISFASGDLIFRTAKLITVYASVSGKVTFRANGIRIAGCVNKAANAGNSYTVTCSYKPSIRNGVTISVTLDPTDASYISNITSSQRFAVLPRASSRT